MRRYKGTFDIFRIEHSMREEEMEEQTNKEVKEGWRVAADDARMKRSLAKKKERLSQSLATREKWPKHVYTSTGNLCSCFFWRGLISLCS